MCNQEKGCRKKEVIIMVAQTILNQLGGNRFVAMTGAKNFVALENGIKFSIGRNASKANTVKITLNGLDLYDIEFIKFTPFKISVNHKTCAVTTREEKTEIVKTYNDCYCDMLQEVFTSVTGLYTHF